MNIMDAYKKADEVKSQDDLMRLLDETKMSIINKQMPDLMAHEVMDGCESFTAGLKNWCAHRGIPYDGTPTWSLVAWIILAGVLND